MKLFDLFRLIFSNLNRRKGRVALTAVGVVIGTAAVVILVSLAIGLQQSANEQLYGIGDLSLIQVSPNYGEMPVVMGGGGGGGGKEPAQIQTVITNQSLKDFAAIPGVESVIPRDYLMASGMLQFNRLEAGIGMIGVGLDDLGSLGLVASQGTTALEKGTVVIGPMVPMNFYDPHYRPGQEPPPPPDLMGQQVKLVLMKWDAEGNEIRKTYLLRVAGILEENRSESDWSIYMRLDDMTVYNEWAMGRRINRARDGYQGVVVKAGDVERVLEITETITGMGYQAFTAQSFVEGINGFYVAMQVIFGGVGAIALLVAAIGIANTMAMAILERTREIGLMKAIGATNRDVLLIFLGEAAGIGFVGGLGGIFSGWLAGQIINVVALVYLAGQAAEQGGLPPSVAASTPLWLLLFALVFATFIGLLSGLYPALRAATMVPVTALKYE
ncbi:MAG: ABC transporter permease [Chloroflexota bacterium]